jgi:hypothetical protein
MSPSADAVLDSSNVIAKADSAKMLFMNFIQKILVLHEQD